MKTNRWSGCWKLGIVSGLAAAIAPFGNCAAQNITLDGSFGPAETLTGPRYVIRQEVGQTVDSNLFHSFGQFSLDSGEIANFESATNIRNILARVTGGSASSIDGLIFTQSPSVNLFLINPNGILFGPNASLDVGGVTRGSFIATTVDALVWSNGGQFSGVNPGNSSSLLTLVGDPSGFLASLRPPRPIVNLDSTMELAQGQSLLLLGGYLGLSGGTLQALGGRVELGGMTGAGTVGLNVDGNNLSLSFPNGVARADVSLTNGAIVNVRASGGGSIAINSRNLDVLGRSRLRAGIALGLGSVDSQAGDIEINATEAINFDEINISNVVLPEAVGNAGDIHITTGSLSVNDGAQLSASTYGQGNAGSVNILARDTVSFDGVGNGLVSGAFSTVGAINSESRAVGKGGDINIQTGSLSVTNDAGLETSTYGQGNAGSVNILARDTVSFGGVGNGLVSAAISRVAEEAVGNGGDINITTGSLSVANGTQLITGTRGQGDAGSVTINARDTVSFDGVGYGLSRNRFVPLSSLASSSVEAGGAGKGGDINITTGSLSVTDGAQLLTNTYGQGDAGSMNILAHDTVSFDGVGSNGSVSTAISRVEEEAVGNGGDINITTGSLSVTNGARLNASTLGHGDAGSVNINAQDTISFDGVGNGLNTEFEIVEISSAAFSTVASGAVGKGGNINITTGSLSLTNGAALIASSEGSGAAGNIEVAARSIRLDNQALLSSDTIAGQGNIFLRSQDLVLRRNSNITTNATGTATGGNITIDTGVIAALENSDISANAQNSFGGRVLIDASGIFGTEFRHQLTPESDITASSDLGADFSGTVEINAPDVDLQNALAELSVAFINPDQVVAGSCLARRNVERGSFTVTGTGGLPPSPYEAISGRYAVTGVQPIGGSSGNVSNNNAAKVEVPAPWKRGDPVQEAQGIVVTPDGRKILGTNSQVVAATKAQDFICQPN